MPGPSTALSSPRSARPQRGTIGPRRAQRQCSADPPPVATQKTSSSMSLMKEDETAILEESAKRAEL